MELYAEYCDSALANADAAARRGRGAGSDTRRRPSARMLAAPLLGLFHGEPGGKRWRFEMDQALRPPGGGRKQQSSRRQKKKKKQEKAVVRAEGEEAEAEEEEAEEGEAEEGEDQELEVENEELEIEERGPPMRDVIARASKAVPAFVLDAPPPTGDRLDSLARAAARAAEVAAESATKHLARKKKGAPLPAPARPLMDLPEPAVVGVDAGGGVGGGVGAAGAEAAAEVEVDAV